MLVNQSKLRVSVQFEPSLSLFNNFGAAKTFEISSNGEISDGVMAELEVLETELVDGYTVKANFIEVFTQVGNGNAKFNFSTYTEGTTNWVKMSMATCGSVRIDAYISAEFSFIFSVAISDDDSDPEVERIKVEDVISFLEKETDPVVLAAKIAYLMPQKETLEKLGEALTVVGIIAIVAGIAYFITEFVSLIILL